MSTHAPPNWSLDPVESESSRERLTRLRELLESRQHMRELMRLGKAKYWEWRTRAQQEVSDLRVELGDAPYSMEPTPSESALKFTSDFEALTKAFDLLHTLSKETDLEPEEQALTDDLRDYLKNKSEPC